MWIAFLQSTFLRSTLLLLLSSANLHLLQKYIKKSKELIQWRVLQMFNILKSGCRNAGHCVTEE